jgi:hypothetical protein
MATSTVSAVLKRIGLGKLSRLEPPELLHIDVKKLGRIGPHGAGHRVTGKRLRRNPRRADGSGVPRLQVGWEFVHVCVDDATRLAYAEVLANERATTAVAFLRRVLTFYRAMCGGGAGDDRQRLSLRLCGLRARLPWAGDQALPHPPLPTRRPTARPSASSARCSPSGPTPPSTGAPSSGLRRYRAGLSATTPAEDTAPSVTDRRSLGSRSSRRTT